MPNPKSEEAEKPAVIHSLRLTAVSSLNGQPVFLNELSHVELTDMLANIRAGAIVGKGVEKKTMDRMAALYFDPNDDSPIDYERSYLFRDGIAYIPIHGLLLNRLSFSGWGVTGYDYIQGAFSQALNAGDVKGIVFDVDSPGGMVQGNFELCGMIKEARGQKPMVAIVNGQCCSGGYSLASAVSSITAMPSADIGSIGVYIMHIDASKMMEDWGLKISFIRAGKRKVDGNPYEPLSDEARASMQAEVDTTYQEFTTLVADNRGMDQQAVIDTEAGVFSAEEAKKLGLIDNVATVQAALTTFTTELTGSSITDGDIEMSKETNEAGGEAAIQEATRKAVAADRDRRKAITNSEEAAGREKLAAHLSDETDMPADAAIAVLKASPKEAAAPAAADPKPKDGDTPFEKAMNTTNNPLVAAEASKHGDELTGAERLLASARKANVGRIRKPA